MEGGGEGVPGDASDTAVHAADLPSNLPVAATRDSLPHAKHSKKGVSLCAGGVPAPHAHRETRGCSVDPESSWPIHRRRKSTSSSTLGGTEAYEIGNSAETHITDSVVMVSLATKHAVSSILLCLCDDAATAYARAVGAIAIPLKEHFNTPSCDRRAMLGESLGHIFHMAHRSFDAEATRIHGHPGSRSLNL